MEAPNPLSISTEFRTQDFQDSEGKMNEIDRVLTKFLFGCEKFIPEVEELAPHIKNSTFAKQMNDEYVDFEDFDLLITDVISTNDLYSMVESPSMTMQDFMNIMEDLIPAHFIKTIADQFPLDVKGLIQSLKPEEQASLAALATIIQSNPKNLTLLSFMGTRLAGNGWHGQPSLTAKSLKACGLFEKHGGVRRHLLYWALLDKEDNFSLLSSVDLSKDTEFKVSNIETSRSGKSLKFFNGNSLGARLTVEGMDDVSENWLKGSPIYPFCIPYSADAIPELVIQEFKDALLKEDTFVLRALLNFEVLKAKDCPEGMLALYKVFASQHLVHRLISTSISYELTATSVTESTILRSNTQLTFLFKIYYEMFGRPFYEHAIKPIRQMVVSKGMLGIKNPEAGPPEDVLDMVNRVLNIIFEGAPYVTPQIRHLAAVLLNGASTILRTRRGVYNALSSLLFLRFTSAMITDPSKFEEFDVNDNKYTILCSTLMQQIFSLQFIGEKFQHLSGIGTTILDRYGEIIDFTYKVADFHEIPEYDVPSDAEVHDSLVTLLRIVSQSRENFIQQFTEIYENDVDRTGPAFAISNFLSHLFQY